MKDVYTDLNLQGNKIHNAINVVTSADENQKILAITKADYEALPTKDPDTYYMIIDDEDESGGASASLAALSAHTGNRNNPHNVTAAQVGAASEADLSGHIADTDNPHNVTAAQIGAATAADLSGHIADTNNPHNVTAAQVGAASEADLSEHIADTDNPHEVTAAQIGAATASALSSHTGNKNNPHSVTAAQIGAATTSELYYHTMNNGNPHGVTLTQLGHVGENLLTNPDFKINQRGASGTVTAAGYFKDRWYLKSGSVTLNANGSLTLNGTIIQILENAAGTNVKASASAGTASYNNSTKTFSLTGNGVTVTWAKLERGSAATAFVSPDPAAELAKCRYYYCKVWPLLGNTATRAGNTVNISTDIPMRAEPQAYNYEISGLGQTILANDDTDGDFRLTAVSATVNSAKHAGVFLDFTADRSLTAYRTVRIYSNYPTALDAEIYP